MKKNNHEKTTKDVEQKDWYNYYMTALLCDLYNMPYPLPESIVKQRLEAYEKKKQEKELER